MTFNMTNLSGKVQQTVLAILILAFPSKAQTIVSMVDAVSDSAIFSTIAGLQGFGTRYCYAGNALQASEWVRHQFLAAGLADAVLDTFASGTSTQANIIATLTGNRYPQKEIIVGAHIDSWSQGYDSAPGADDDASGTAAILEIARIMIASDYRPPITIRFVGFAAEEPGLLGSSMYATRATRAKSDIILMINFDMIGYTTSADPERHFDIIHYPPDTETAALVASAATSFTSLRPVVTTVDQANVDSFPFAMEGYAAVTCSEFLDNPFYHKPVDLISTLDTTYVGDITRAGLAAILLVAGIPTSIRPMEPSVPLRAKLEQNYPNPFNPSTQIKFTVGGFAGSQPAPALPDRQAGFQAESLGLRSREDRTSGPAGGEPGARNTRLVVYDLLGREVAVLVDEPRAPGEYQVSFDAGGLSSGVYYYRLRTGSFVQTRALIVLK